ncbi:MAG TPA: DUF4286 family protein [Flavobacteriales bacterium]|jgi:hypothetical protein|nr:DUF4286 family protein [Flavobacteriales bacterium]
MYIYNITFNVDKEIEPQWLDYIKTVFIPKMLKSGLLKSSLTSKIMVDEAHGNSYSIQFAADSQEALKEFIEKELYPILNELHLKFSPKMVYFATELDVIDRQKSK